MMVVMAVMAEALHLRKSYGNWPRRVKSSFIVSGFNCFKTSSDWFTEHGLALLC